MWLFDDMIFEIILIIELPGGGGFRYSSVLTMETKAIYVLCTKYYMETKLMRGGGRGKVLDTFCSFPLPFS